MSRDPLVDTFNSVGGWQFFENLIDSFYDKIERDPVLRPMYPENLDHAKKKLMLFISQRFGGPREYEKLRGHAKLRRRHLKFPIGIDERDRWMAHMQESLIENNIEENNPYWNKFVGYFSMVADKMVNTRHSGEDLDTV